MGKLLVAFVVLSAVFSCGKNDDGPPPAPEAVLLVFPEQNSECTTGAVINENQTQVTFSWQASVNTDEYILTVINLESNSPQAIRTRNTSASVAIEKGTPFSWSVVSTNSNSTETATSENWLFYNAGAQTNYAPFPAQILAPKSGSTVFMDQDGQVVLQWSGADVEEDIETFEVYFSATNPPEELVQTLDNTTSSLSVSVASGNTYYWRVVTIDALGNTSDSGVFDFKVY